MKLEDMIMVVENRKGQETNFLLSLRDYMEMVLKACEDSAVDMADAISQLYGTREGKEEWSELYFAGNKSSSARYCTGEAQLRGFLMGSFNDSGWLFDEERCSRECFEVLRTYGMKTDGHGLFNSTHYEPVEHVFQSGEICKNMNGKEYRVLAVLSPDNLLLMGESDSQLVVGKGVQLYDRYPKGEEPAGDNVVRGIEWGHGIYLGNDITRLDFDILKQEYGIPDKVENISDLRDCIRRNFYMHKNVEEKRGLSARIRSAAKDSMEQQYGTNEPEVFQVMLEKGMYDGMFPAREIQKKEIGEAR